MTPFTVDELVAIGQFMVVRVRTRKPVLVDILGPRHDRWAQTIAASRSTVPSHEHLLAPAWGVSIPWMHGVSIAIAVWHMLAPVLFGSRETMADGDHLVRMLISTTVTISTAEVGLVSSLLGRDEARDQHFATILSEYTMLTPSMVVSCWPCSCTRVQLAVSGSS